MSKSSLRHYRHQLKRGFGGEDWRKKELPTKGKPTKKRLDFVFHVGLHYAENPSRKAAKRVAEVLRKRGHKVTIIQAPKEVQHHTLTNLRNPNPQEVLRFFRNQKKHRQSVQSKKGHVIEWHNSSLRTFFEGQTPSTDTSSMNVVHRSAMKWPTGKPIVMALMEKSTPMRLVAALELPAYEKRLSEESPLGRRQMRMTEQLGGYLEEAGASPEEANEYLEDYTKRTGAMFSVNRTREYGLLDEEFLQGVADRLEEAASNPQAVYARAEDYGDGINPSRQTRSPPSSS